MNNKTSEVSLITKDGFELAQRTATVLSKSDLVPKQFQNNLPNCIIAINMANRIGADPLMVMQNLYVVHGKPSWSSTFLISAINFSKKYKGALKFELSGEGDARQCIAWVTDLDGERLESPAVSIAMAKKEGWYSKTGSKWQTMPELMLRYRAAAFFSRIYCPEITMGMHTIDEVQDVEVLSSNIHSSVNISDELEKRIIIHINNATTIATLEQVANDLTDNTKTLYNDKYNEIQSKLFASSDSETKKTSDLVSKTAQSYLIELFIEQNYNRKKDISSKYTSKGNLVEELSMTLLCEVDKTFYKKNEENLSNEFISGTPDIITQDCVIDIKSSWDIWTFANAEVTPANYWQMQGYLWLTGKTKGYVNYCLSDTPEMLIKDEQRRFAWQNNILDWDHPETEILFAEIERNMTYSDIPSIEKVKKFEIDFDEDSINQLKYAIERARIFYEKIKL